VDTVTGCYGRHRCDVRLISGGQNKGPWELHIHRRSLQRLTRQPAKFTVASLSMSGSSGTRPELNSSRRTNMVWSVVSKAEREGF
jgi:hypothetical protein